MLYNKVAITPPYFHGDTEMENYKRRIEHNFAERKFPDIKLEGCSLTEYNPSQTDRIYAAKGIVFVIVSDGKGYVTKSEKRSTLTKGTGFAVETGGSLLIKADNIEPFTVMAVNLSGEASKLLYDMIEKREQDLIMNFSGNGKIIDSARDLITECSKTYASDYGIMLAFFEFLNSIDDHYTEKKIPSKNVYMTRAVEYIKQNYNKNISVENISDLLGIERSYLSRLFKTYKNKSTQNYIIDYRMEQAKRMFEEEDMNVSQVSTAVGYNNIYCFSRIFKSRVGMPPKEYMESCKKRSL